MFTKTGVVCFFLFSFIHLCAQRDTLSIKCELLKPQCNWDYGAGARFSFLDFEEMNRALSNAGLPELESPVPCVALAARSSLIWRELQLEAALEFTSGSSQRDALNNRQSVVFRDYGIRTRAMLDVFPQNRFSKVFPFAGLGLSYQAVRTKSGLINNNVPGSPVQETFEQRFTLAPLVCELGLSLEQGISVRNKDVFVGLRGGYAFRFINNNWIENGQTEVANLPRPAASAPFVAMMLRIKTAPACDPKSRLLKQLGK
ncbi:MAG: hypothetical protein KDC61_17665 [Saprospiraceae bacterium]|nr:hypothetical protein [Saprospiraceae bacterium]MCB0542197.1 hypothetical protein [Saprospiraceae bacterium]MCB0576387.1 hypothetical protein [Saprospiraceae bacterium]MCB9356183.1 hypothetical protein [Lewinellaceae bacterium]